MATSALRVLLIEDDLDVPALVEAILERADDGPYELSTVGSMAEAEVALRESGTDVVLVDLGLPDSDGVGTITRLVEQHPRLPIVVLSGAAGEAIAIDSVRAGAQDYIPKQRLDRYLLPRILRHAIERARLQHMLHEEAQLLRDANERLNRFAGTVAHDLKGPLAGLYGIVETLKLVDKGGLNEVQRDLIGRLGTVATRANAVVDALLEDAREANDRREKVDLAELVTEVVETVQLDTPAGPATVTHQDLPVVWGNPTLIRQVLTNLIANAVVHGRRDRPPHVKVSSEIDDEVVITVSDDGPGVPEELRERIFTEGFSTRDATEDHAGMGQGLAMCATAVARLGGRIWVEDGRLGGADIRVALPKRVSASA